MNTAKAQDPEAKPETKTNKEADKSHQDDKPSKDEGRDFDRDDEGQAR